MVDKIHRQTKGLKFDLLIAMPSHSAESKDRHSLVGTKITKEYLGLHKARDSQIMLNSTFCLKR